MPGRAIRLAFVAVTAALVAGSAFAQPAAQVPAAKVDAAAIEHQPAGEWLSYGRTYSEQRFSPLDQINTANVKQLGVAWDFRTYTVRGLEGTPLVANGVMYVTGSWSKLWALDAKTGKELWSYDPKVPGSWGRYACCDVVNRGVALWRGAVYLGTLDGRLVKLDAKTGKLLWSVNTIDRSRPYTITGAPRVVDGLVVIGNGGAEYDTRGYLTAYDANTGKQAWRFYVVPGNPKKPQENPALKAALKTWNAGGKYKWWQIGGGGAPWNAMAFDPKLGLLYVGTGNGDPWNRNIRSPGGGDNLYLSSILALNVKTGRLAWYYQVTPGDTWDFDATADLILADLRIDGKLRHVIMQAPKNGFFYVLDRATGKLISAEKFVPVNWATGIDMKTGRPIQNPAVRYGTTPVLVSPGAGGGHNWDPMAYSPLTRLAYFPVTETYMGYGAADSYDPAKPGIGTSFTGHDAERSAITAYADAHTRGWLTAWNPATQKE
ncbi:MAG: PQQ-dependent dehydrogenase, methanol/ethanol family, partial [Alphaproteobacteria bacterium]|nr:PQQ-dependent dehydrogenase, methanol/ethanol family [Alphaproteobacteria bacterium]